MPVRHVVLAGEGIDSIAYRYGFFPDTIWAASENAALRRERLDRNILQEGDVVIIPDKGRKAMRVATGKCHVFRRRGVPAVFRVRLLKRGVPRANVDCVLVTGDVRLAGRTNSDGVLELYVPPDSIDGALTIGDEAPIPIGFGQLDPVTSIRGVQQRLGNLGFTCRNTGGELDESTMDALRRFQASVEIEESGLPDDATRDALVRLHDTLRGGSPTP